MIDTQNKCLRTREIEFYGPERVPKPRNHSIVISAFKMKSMASILTLCYNQ